MSNIIQNPAASIASAQTFKLSDRIPLPCVVTRDEAKALAAKLWADDSNALSGASNTATNDALATKVVSLALTKMVFGEHSRLERTERYASTLPEYKKTRAGLITGPIGKRLTILREAVTIGLDLRSRILNVDSVSEFNLKQIFGGSPVLGGMLAAPPKAKTAVEDATVTAARAESLAKAEAERNAKLAEEATKTEAERNAVKLSIQEIQVDVLTMGSDLDNIAASEQFQIHRLETARALRLAEESARENAEQEARFRQEGKDLITKIHAFCALGVELGVKLTPAQLRILDQLEYPKAA